MDAYGYLSNFRNDVTPNLLNLVMQSETGHLSMKDRFDPRKSKSRKGAIGGYQLMPNLLPDYGYGMDKYSVNDALDPIKSRNIAGELIKGYSGHYGFNNVADTLIGYNMGAKATSDWIKNGRKLEDLPNETKSYLKRAMGYIKDNPDEYSLEKIAEVSNDDTEGTTDMNMFTPNYYRQLQAQNFITGEGNRSLVEDPYSEGYGFYGMDAPAPVLANQHIVGNPENNRFVSPETNGVLTDNNNMMYEAAAGNNNGVMSANASTLNNNGILSDNQTNGRYVAKNMPFISDGGIETPTLMKRRDNQDLSKGVTKPNDQIDLNEMLIRIGGAGLANSQLGGNRQIADATGMYGNIMDYNRSQALQKYKIDMANSAKTAKQARADRDYLGTIDQSLGDMDRALAGIKDGGVTGLFDGTIVAWWDSLRGNQEAKTRLLLQKLKVDDTLLRIAQTKGAISNKEMDLFMSPAPSVGLDQENIWADWINERKQALQRIKARLTGNMQVVPSQQATQSQIINGVTVTRVK